MRGVAEDSEEYRIQKACVEDWERQGYKVHWPHRDTEQKDPERGTGICRTTFWGIVNANEVRVRFDPTSEGFVADLMMTFVLNELGKVWGLQGIIGCRKVVIVNPKAVEQKIKEEVEEQVKKGIDPKFAKSYTMVLKNLADETANL